MDNVLCIFINFYSVYFIEVLYIEYDTIKIYEILT